jgi:Ca2+-binding EF-hand superfamily protein
MQSNASSRERAEFYFDVFDKDKSGTLDRQEILKLNEVLMRSMFGMLATGVAAELMRTEKIKMLLSDADILQFTREFVKRLQEMKLEEKLTDYIFQKVDKDDSKEITKSEYVAFLEDEEAQQGLHGLIACTFAEMSTNARGIVNTEAAKIMKKAYHF